MASITKVNNKYIVRYDYKDKNGKRKQKWEEFFKKADAEKFKLEVELNKHNDNFINPSTMTVEEFLNDWIEIHAQSNWEYKTYANAQGMSNNHIIPAIGKKQIQQVSSKDIEKFINGLKFKKVSGSKSYNKSEQETPCLSPTTVGHIYTMLKTAFDKAVEWDIISKNPVTCQKPKRAKVVTKIWSADNIRLALDNIENELLHLAVHLAFVGSLRIGEVLGITFDCVDIDNMEININKTLQRIDAKSLDVLPKDNLYKAFPPKIINSKSILVLKSPKTLSSNRTIYITKELKDEILKRKQKIEVAKKQYDIRYEGENLLFALDDGYPVEPKLCENWFNKWQKESTLGFPKIVFHELRHSSTTYKLLLSGGDIKSVQGDTGHASADMVINRYSHTQDKSRIKMISMLENDFYKRESSEFENMVETILSDEELKKEILLRLNANKNIVCT